MTSIKFWVLIPSHVDGPLMSLFWVPAQPAGGAPTASGYGVSRIQWPIEGTRLASSRNSR